MVRSEGTMEDKDSNFVVLRKVGGSIIERRPVFSVDSKTVFVACGQIVRSYNSKSGEFVRSYEGLEGTVVGIQLSPVTPDHLVALSDRGELLEWNWKTGGEIRKINLVSESKIRKYVGFHVIGSPGSKNSACSLYGVFSKPRKDSLRTSLYCFSSGVCKKENVNSFELTNHYHSYAFGGDPQQAFLAGIDGKLLQVFMLEGKLSGRKQTVKCKHELTCVACHPTLCSVLVGDQTGCILLWQGFFCTTNPVAAQYHWHTLPVDDIIFSYVGTHFYSAGGEGVLVRWTIDAPNQKKYLPRLPAPLVHLALASENALLAITTLDNAIQLVDSSFKLVSVIQPFSWSAENVRSGLGAFPAGLAVDVRSRALVLNGGTGRVQFISLLQNSLLYQVNVTGQNILTQERGKVITNTDVIRLALSCDGFWMATVEHRDDKNSSPELRLKFWQYNVEKQTFCLNTCIDSPHESIIHAVEFQPVSSSNRLLAVTSGDDCKFRIWSLVDNQSIYKQGKVWRNESVGFFRDLPARDVSFSEDGSLLAATFGPTLTVWISDSGEMKCSLTRSTGALHELTCVEFGHRDCVHLVVTGSKSGIAVWNLLSLSLAWTAELPLNLLASDPASGTMAAFTEGRDVVLFSPLHAEPVHVQRSVVGLGTRVVGAVFVPGTGASKHQHCQLYFATSKWELLALERAQEKTDAGKEVMIADRLSVAPRQPLTPFGALVARQTTSDVKALEGEKHHLVGVPGTDNIKQLLASAAHTAAPVSLLCGSVLLALVRRAGKAAPSRTTQPAEDGDSGIVSSDEDDGEVSAPPTFELRKEQALARRSEDPTSRQPASDAISLEDKLSLVLDEPLDWAKALTL